MLPPFIIAEIRKREQARKERRQMPVLRIPEPVSDTSDSSSEGESRNEDDDEQQRGVVVIDLGK